MISLNAEHLCQSVELVWLNIKGIVVLDIMDYKLKTVFIETVEKQQVLGIFIIHNALFISLPFKSQHRVTVVLKQMSVFQLYFKIHV